MSSAAFFTEHARARAARAVAAVEADSGVELVIAVQQRSGDYRAADLVFGFFLAELTLIGLLYLETEFALIHFPLDVAIAFVVGAALCANVEALRRRLLSPKRMKAEVERTARSAFVERAVSRTSGRIGILVYASMFERRVALVPDVGVDLETLGEDWNAFERRLEASVAARDFDAFISALESSGPMFARVHPRPDGDVNELADEMHVA